ncbi:MAG: hypothetical protein HUJ60_06775 [Bacilli bacterium]|nr:hypothetical protein [Bacilli bacterium]
MNLPPCFLELSALYEAHGYSLFLIGGTSRDLLLGLSPLDLDFVTDAPAEASLSFLDKADGTFARYGSIKVHHGEQTIDITTLREEGDYRDSRHPGYLRFIQDKEKDSQRRDFTVNALYIDKDGTIYDYHRGLEDLEKKVLRFIGDPQKRIEEDPLRIIRAERFAKRLGFAFEEKTKKAIEENRHLLAKLNPDKIAMELKKE